MEGEHNSLHDAQAQCTIVKDRRFRVYIDKPKSIQLMEAVWADRRKKMEARYQELNRPVPNGWTEEIPNDAVFLDGDKYNK